MRSVAGVVDSEIDERFDLAMGAHEALIELELPGVGVIGAGLGAAGSSPRARPAHPRAGRRGWRPPQVDAPPRTLEPEHVRMAASSWRHGPDAYRVVCGVARAASTASTPRS